LGEIGTEYQDVFKLKSSVLQARSICYKALLLALSSWPSLSSNPSVNSSLWSHVKICWSLLSCEGYQTTTNWISQIGGDDYPVLLHRNISWIYGSHILTTDVQNAYLGLSFNRQNAMAQLNFLIQV